MKNKIIVILFLLVSINVYSKYKPNNIDILLNLNTRNAEDSKLFDYYSKLEVTENYSNFRIKEMGNFERDNGVEYYSYSFDIKSKNSLIQYYKDTEKYKEYYVIAVFVGCQYVNIGVESMQLNDLKNNNIKYIKSIYITGSYKNYFEYDISYDGKFEKIILSSTPSIKYKDFNLGIKCNYILLDNTTKWNCGVIISKNINFK